MKISLLTMNHGNTDVEGHRAGCADIAKKVAKRQAEEPWELEVNSEREAFLAYNEDFIAEADGDESHGWTITWFPCCSELPPVHEDWFPAEVTELVATTTSSKIDEVELAKPITKTEAFGSLTALRVLIRKADTALGQGNMGDLVDSLELVEQVASALRAVALDTGINTVTWVNK